MALAIVHALKWDAVVPTDELEVVVSHGYVTLKGQVDWYYQREAAGRVVQRLAGVKAVNNTIIVVTHPAPEDIKQLCVAHLRRIELHLDHFRMAGAVTAYVLVGRIFRCAASVATRRRGHPLVIAK